jgi:hypothetical protein
MTSNTLALTMDLGVYIVAVGAYYVATRYFHRRRFSADTWTEGWIVCVLSVLSCLLGTSFLIPFGSNAEVKTNINGVAPLDRLTNFTCGLLAVEMIFMRHPSRGPVSGNHLGRIGCWREGPSPDQGQRLLEIKNHKWRVN